METKIKRETTSRPVGRDTIRSRLMLEVASELVDQPGWSIAKSKLACGRRGQIDGR